MEGTWPPTGSALCPGGGAGAGPEDKGMVPGAGDPGPLSLHKTGTSQSWVGTEPAAAACLTNSSGISGCGGRMAHEDVYFRAWE